jgi:assimilatory nitrate reductase catalytic subunit
MSPRLGSHSPEPFIEIHPADAKARKLTDGGFAKVTTPIGSAILKVAVTAGQQRGSIFAPIHWSDTTAAHARIGELVAAANDPYSGQPELKATPARIEQVEFAYRGFALTRHAIALPAGAWFARVAVANGEGLLFATNEPLDFWQDFSATLATDEHELAEYVDPPRGLVRVAAFRSGQLDACIFVGPAKAPPQWDAVRSLFEAGVVSERDRRILLSGRSSDGLAETGPLICACYSVGLTAIRKAIATGEAASVDDIGRTLRAGTNCGSCVAELRAIIEEMAKPAGSPAGAKPTAVPASA